MPEACSGQWALPAVDQKVTAQLLGSQPHKLGTYSSLPLEEDFPIQTAIRYLPYRYVHSLYVVQWYRQGHLKISGGGQ